MTTSPNPRLPKTIWALGFVSLFMDVASEIIHGVLPLFLVSTLGASLTTVGFIEGLGESLALVVRVFSGTLSDKIGKRKPLLILGYLLGTVSKPIFAIASNIGIVMLARSIDRIGKGIRGAPRDALIADVTPQSQRGAAYGLRQSLDSVGAFVGPALAILLLFVFADNFRLVFWIAVIPGMVSLIVLLFFVKENTARQNPKHSPIIHFQTIATLSTAFWRVLSVGVVFTLARFSEAFLLLRAQSLGLPTHWVPGVLALLSLFYALGAYPAGILSDRIDRSGLLCIGMLLLFLSDIVLGLSTQLIYVAVGTALWGLHMAFTQGILAALVADTTNHNQRGTAFGLFGLATGLAVLLASVVAGLLWDRFGASLTFFSGALFAFLALGFFIAWRQRIISH